MQGNDKSAALLSKLPSYVREYHDEALSFKKENSVLSDLYCIKGFLSFLTAGEPVDMTKERLHSINEKGILSYKTAVENSDTRNTGRRKFAAVCPFLSWAAQKKYTRSDFSETLQILPFAACPTAIADKITWDLMINGALSVRLHLIQDGVFTGEVVECDPPTFRRKQPYATRNASMLSLLSEGLFTIPELTALNTLDLDEKNKTLAERPVPEESWQILMKYIKGEGNLAWYEEKYGPDAFDTIEWCKRHMTTTHLNSAALRHWNDCVTGDFLKDLEDLSVELRKNGRKSLIRNYGEKALFINRNGRRLTPRFLQELVNETKLMYAPDRELTIPPNN